MRTARPLPLPQPSCEDFPPCHGAAALRPRGWPTVECRSAGQLASECAYGCCGVEQTEERRGERGGRECPRAPRRHDTPLPAEPTFARAALAATSRNRRRVSPASRAPRPFSVSIRGCGHLGLQGPTKARGRRVDADCSNAPASASGVAARLLDFRATAKAPMERACGAPVKGALCRVASDARLPARIAHQSVGRAPF